ncbi:MAG: hypothetical protein KKA60_05855 [Proteobacteria bacterium]|nr:hypothetical protein [Pseudomonadota bacterium]
MDKIQLLILLISLITVVLVVTMLLVLLMVRRMKQARARTMEELAQSMGGRGEGEAVFGEHEGVPYAFAFFDQPKGPTFGNVIVPTDAPGFMALRQRDWLDSLGERLGMLSPVVFNDPAWDGRITLVADNPAMAGAWFRDSSRRRTAVDLCGEKGSTITVRDGFAFMRFISRARRKAVSHTDTGMIREKVARTAALGKAATWKFPGPINARTLAATLPHQKITAWTVSLCMGLLGLGGVTLALSLGIFYEPAYPHAAWAAAARWAAPLGLGAWAMLIFGARRVLSTRLDGHRALVVAASLGLPVVILAFLGAFFFTNGFLDDSPPATSSAVVTRLQIIHGKSKTYKVWAKRPDGSAPVGVGVSLARFKGFRQGETVFLTTRPGRHGVEWVLELEKPR